MSQPTPQQIAALLASSLDRLDEAHWHLHEMDQHYHRAQPFRYSLNSFLRTVKEVPQILKMEMQNTSGFTNWYNDHTREVYNDALLQYVFKQRDVVVHRSMLLPRSTVMFGITEGRGLKAGLGREANPRMDSDVVMFNYVRNVPELGDWFGILQEDEESEPCVERQWRLEQFPDLEISSLAEAAWAKVGSLIAATIDWLGGPPMELQLTCRHSEQLTRFLTFDREGLWEAVALAKAGGPEEQVYARVAQSARRLNW